MRRCAPITVLYKAPRRERLHRAAQGRAQPAADMTPVPADTGGVRALLRALKRGEAIGILPDQVPSAGDGVWAPFFGRPAFTMTLPARLAEKTGAPVYVLATPARVGRGLGIHLSSLPARAASRARRGVINQRTRGHHPRRRPEQYVWSYNRYKVPPGMQRAGARRRRR